ncbi:expressed unknown protein [Seminavis robusta]|uniref:Uncharacterized protein n=1 Tax=Seminavis robusta TaxID=568900 RepID=A0A9N8E1D3_9STRA|nr:expressed unknown protein [Seminavis robusta]|eukprot:Sro551_g164820.1 n/a (847) ;mRNA; f:13980-16697
MSFTVPLSSGAESAVRFVTAVDPAILLLEKLPYVGPILRNIRVRNIFKSAKSKIKNGKKTLIPFNSTVGIGHEAVLALPAKMAIFQGFLFLTVCPKSSTSWLGRSLVRLTRCAFVDKNTPLQDTLNAVTDTVIDAVDKGYSILTTLRGTLQGLSDFWDSIEKTVLTPMGAVKKTLDSVNKIFGMFSFLQTLAEFKLRFKIPIVGRIEFGLPDIANFLGKIERTIKNIPFVGSAWRTVENIVKSVLSAISPKIELSLPSLDFLDALSPFVRLENTLDDIVISVFDRLSNAADVVDNWVADLADGIDIGSIFERVDLGLPGSDLLDGCEAADESFDFSCLSAITPEIPGAPTQFIKDGIDLFTAAKDQIEEKFMGHALALGDALAGIECSKKSKTGIPEEATEELLKSVFGIGAENCKECAALFDSSMPTQFEYCSDFRMDETKARDVMQGLIQDMQPLLDDMQTRFADLGAANPTGRQLLSKEEIAQEGWAVVFSLTLPAHLLKFSGEAVGEAFGFAADHSSSIHMASEKIVQGKGDVTNAIDYILKQRFSSVDKDVPTPRSIKLNAASKEVFTLNFAITAKEDDTGVPRFAYRISLGARLQVQLGFGLDLNYISIVKPKLDLYNKVLESTLSFDRSCAECAEHVIEKMIPALDNFARRLASEIRLFNKDGPIEELRKSGLFKNSILKPVSGGFKLEAKPFDEVVAQGKSLGAAKMAKTIGGITKALKLSNLIEELDALDVSHKLRNSNVATGAATHVANYIKKNFFFQIRVKARGTQFPVPGVQLLKTPDPKDLVKEFQEKTRKKGNFAILLNQPEAPQSIGATAHVGLGFSIMSFEQVTGPDGPD